MSIQRRFIAGASCPECGAADRVRRCDDGERRWIDCLACGMEQPLEAPPGQSQASPATGAPVQWKGGGKGK